MTSTKPERLNFVGVRRKANECGLSMDRHHIKGFRVWNNSSPAEKFNAKNRFMTLAAAQEFIQNYKKNADLGNSAS